MPATPEGLAFLEAFTQYIDFRLTEQGRPKPAPLRMRRFVVLFERFLRSRGGNPRSAAFKNLKGKMRSMKTGGGGAGRKPT